MKVLTNDGLIKLVALINGKYAPLNSPELTGTPTAPTPAVDNDSTRIATTAFVQDVAENIDTGVMSVVTGTANGTLSVDGTDVAVKGLQSAAYADTSDFAAVSHNQASNTINLMTGYSKPNSTSAIGTSDSLNDAIGKLEKALENKAPKASPAFTGTPTAPNPASDDDSTQIATTAWVNDAVDTAVAGLVDSAPEALDTLNELSAALNDNPNFATDILNAIGEKVPTGSANYIKSASVSGKTLTLTKGNDTTVTFTETDTTYDNATTTADGLMSSTDKTKLDGIAANANNYSHPTSGVAAGTYGPAANVTGSEGNTIVVPEITVDANGHVTTVTDRTYTSKDTTYSNATTSAAGLMSAADKTKLNGIADNANNYTHPDTAGNIHIPSGGSDGQILTYGGSSGTAAWTNPTVYSAATTEAAGLMSAADKTKLNGIEANANNYSHPASTVTADTYGPSADVTGSEGNTIKVPEITVDANGHVTAVTERTYTSKDTTYSAATSSDAGLMSAADKTKLDNIEDNANNYTHPNTSGNKHIPSGGSAGNVLIYASDGTAAWGTLTASDINAAPSDINTGVMTVTTGSTNGTVAVNGTDVTVYTHPTDAGNKHIPSGGSSGQILKYSAAGTATWANEYSYTHPSDGANTGSFGPSANTSPGYGGTFSVPYVTINSAGHVTAASTKTITMPAADTALTDSEIEAAWNAV